MVYRHTPITTNNYYKYVVCITCTCADEQSHQHKLTITWHNASVEEIKFFHRQIAKTSCHVDQRFDDLCWSHAVDIDCSDNFLCFKNRGVIKLTYRYNSFVLCYNITVLCCVITL